MSIPPPLTSQLTVLLFTDLLDSSKLKTQLGDRAYAEQVAAPHNRLFRELLQAFPGAAINNFMGDGFLATFARVSDAVNFALLFHQRLDEAARTTPMPMTRIGIYVGELITLDDGSIAGHAADMCARLMSLGGGRQTLLTRHVFDDARQHVRKHPVLKSEAAATPPELAWQAHGRYEFKGKEDDPLEVFEVGAVGFAPLVAPHDSEKARRKLNADEEATLGWRPAIGQEVPSKPHWVLQKQLGVGGFGEVWLVKHRKTQEEKVFKFCFDADRLRSFKRELTLFRLLRKELGDRPDIAKIHDIRLDQPPFYLELDYAPLGNLQDWVATKQGLLQLPLQQRLDLLARVCDAVEAAHSIDVMHKDLKPSNILMYDDRGEIKPRLCDFGIGVLADLTRLENADITRMGFTQTLLAANDSSRTGTRLYAPPETLMGQPFTKLGDVYALGVMFYQLVIGKFDQPIAYGWERDVAEGDLTAAPNEAGKLEQPSSIARAVYKETIGLAIEGNPTRRVPSAAELARLIRALPTTIATREAEEKARVTELARAETKRKTRVLKWFLGISASVLVVVGTLGAMIYLQWQRAEAKTDQYRRGIYNLQVARAWQTRQTDPELSKRLLDDPERCPWNLRELTWNLVNSNLSKNSEFILGEKCRPNAVAFSADGDKVIYAWGNRLHRWNCKLQHVDSDRAFLYPFIFEGETRDDNIFGIRSIVCSASNFIAIGMTTGLRMIHADEEIRQANFDWLISNSAVSLLAINPDGKLISYVDDRKRLILQRGLDKYNITDTRETIRNKAANSSYQIDEEFLKIIPKFSDVWKLDYRLDILATQKVGYDALAFSNDGKWLAACNAEGTVEIFSTDDTHRREHTITVKKAVTCMAFSADDLQLIVGTNRGELIRYDIDTDKSSDQPAAQKFPGEIRAISTTGKKVVWTTDAVDLWVGSFDQDKQQCIYRGTRQLYECLAVSKDNKFIYAGTADGRIVSHNLTDKTSEEWQGHVGCIVTLASSPTSNLLVSTGNDGLIKFWKTDCNDGRIKLWNTKNNSLLTTRYIAEFKRKRIGHSERNDIKEFADPIYTLSFSPSGKTLVASSSQRIIYGWQIESQPELSIGPTCGLHDADGKLLRGQSVRFTPDGTCLTLKNDDEIAFWDVNTRKLLKNIDFTAPKKPQNEQRYWSGTVDSQGNRFNDWHNINIAFSLDGTRMAAIRKDDYSLVTLDIAAGKIHSTLDILQKLPEKSLRGVVQSLALSNDGKTLAANGLDGGTQLWDPVLGQERFSLADSGNRLRDWDVVEFSRDNSLIAVATGQGGLKVNSIPNNTRIGRVQSNGVNDCLFADSADSIWTIARSKWLQKYDLNTGGIVAGSEVDIRKQLTSLHAPYFSEETRVDLLLSPFGNRAVSVWKHKMHENKQIIDLWDFPSLKHLQTLSNPAGMEFNLNSLAVSAEGSTIALISNSREVVVWQTGNDQSKKIPKKYGEIQILMLFPDGSHLVDETGDVWSLTKDEPIKVREISNPLAISTDGKILLAYTGKQLDFISLPDYKVIKSIAIPNMDIRAAWFSKNARYFAVSGYVNKKPSTIIYDTHTVTPVQSIDDTPYQLIFSPDNKYILCDSSYGNDIYRFMPIHQSSVSEWEFEAKPSFMSNRTEKIFPRLQPNGNLDGSDIVATTPDSNWIIIDNSYQENKDRKLIAWDLQQGTPRYINLSDSVKKGVDTTKLGKMPIKSIDGSLLLRCRLNQEANYRKKSILEVVDVVSGAMISQIDSDDYGEIHYANISADNKYVLIAKKSSEIAIIQIWDVKTGKLSVECASNSRNSWLVMDSEGRYDASDDKIFQDFCMEYDGYYISFRQLREQFYEPELLRKVLGYDKTPLRDVPSLDPFRIMGDKSVVHQLERE